MILCKYISQYQIKVSDIKIKRFEVFTYRIRNKRVITFLHYGPHNGQVENLIKVLDLIEIRVIHLQIETFFSHPIHPTPSALIITTGGGIIGEIFN